MHGIHLLKITRKIYFSEFFPDLNIIVIYKIKGCCDLLTFFHIFILPKSVVSWKAGDGVLQFQSYHQNIQLEKKQFPPSTHCLLLFSSQISLI